jgi:formylmethanofuran dehydrogenase subunit C
LMAGGHLTIKGNAGPWAGSGMTGGEIEITGASGDRLGGPLAGEMSGMRGGLIVVRGNVGDRAGDRMRRGTIIVEGAAGSHPGSRMIAGTLIVRRRAGPLPGYLMRRGTIILGEGSDELSPTFLDGGVHELVAMRLLAAFVNHHSAKVASALRRPLRRLAGDMAVLGKGELFCPRR